MRLPVVGAPMFIVSTPQLVLAQCKAGIVGSFPALNARPASQLDEWLSEITETLAALRSADPLAKIAPFAVNQIVHASNDRLEHDVRMCVKHRVPIVITSLRPPTEVVQAVHSYGGIVFHDVINLRHAEKAAAQGVDGIIAVCAGAGGHAGVLSPFALVKQIREVYPGTIILSGAMSTGADVLAAEALGADLAYLGTRFIATAEANAIARVQADAHRVERRGHRLHLAVQRRPRQLSARQRQPNRAGSGQIAGGRQDQNEFRQRRHERAQGVARYLERRTKRERHPRGRERCSRWCIACRTSTRRRDRGFASDDGTRTLRLNADQLPAALTRGLAPIYLVSGR